MGSASKMNRWLGANIVEKELTDDQIRRLASGESTGEDIAKEQGERWTFGLCQAVESEAKVKAREGRKE